MSDVASVCGQTHVEVRKRYQKPQTADRRIPGVFLENDSQFRSKKRATKEQDERGQCHGPNTDGVAFVTFVADRIFAPQN